MADADDPAARRPIDRATVVVGGVTGFVLDPLAGAMVSAVLSRAFPGFGDSAWWLVSFFVLPVLCAPLLLWPRTRQAGAGLLIGVAVGAVVFAGSCVGLSALVGAMVG